MYYFYKSMVYIFIFSVSAFILLNNSIIRKITSIFNFYTVFYGSKIVVISTFGGGERLISKCSLVHNCNLKINNSRNNWKYLKFS